MDAIQVLGAVAGGGLVGAGVWVLARARPAPPELDPETPEAPVALAGLGSISRPTALTLGLALAGVGYHLLAWCLPAGWLALRVPVERWWVVPGFAVVAVAASLGADAASRRGGNPGGGGA